MFQSVRRTNWFTFVVITLFVGFSPILALYLLPMYMPTPIQYIATMTETLSYGLLNFYTFYNAATAFLVVIFILLTSNLKLRDLGLSSDLRKAAIFTVLLWALTQAALLIWQLVVLSAPQWNSMWRRAGATFVLGSFSSQILGNALYEEIVFRGFIFVQLCLFFARRKIRYLLLTALVTSQIFFALIHIPKQIIVETHGWSELPLWLLATGVAGIIFALCYVKTQNLFIAVGVHALFNAPVQLFLPPVEDSQIPATFVTLLALALIFLPPFSRLWETKPKPLAKRLYSGTDA